MVSAVFPVHVCLYRNQIPSELCRIIVDDYLYRRLNNETIILAAKDLSRAKLLHGPIEHWDTSKVTNMKALFNENRAFNENINNWDVSKVTKMHGMFRCAAAFNQPLDKWNTSKVVNMKQMFSRVVLFNQCIANWKVWI